MKEKQIKLIDDSDDKKYFTIIPNYILNHSSAVDQALYLQMKRIAGDSGLCAASIRYFCKQLNIGVKALNKSLVYLKEHNWVAKMPKKRVQTASGCQYVNVYKVNDIWKMNIDYYQGVSESTHLESKDEVRCSQKEGRGVAESKQEEEQRKKEHNIILHTEQSSEVNNLVELFKPLNPIGYKRWYSNKTQRGAIERLNKEMGDKLKFAIEAAAKVQGLSYAPGISTPLQLEEKLPALRAFIIKQKTSQNKVCRI